MQKDPAWTELKRAKQYDLVDAQVQSLIVVKVDISHFLGVCPILLYKWWHSLYGYHCNTEQAAWLLISQLEILSCAPEERKKTLIIYSTSLIRWRCWSAEAQVHLKE